MAAHEGAALLPVHDSMELLTGMWGAVLLTRWVMAPRNRWSEVERTLAHETTILRCDERLGVMLSCRWVAVSAFLACVLTACSGSGGEGPTVTVTVTVTGTSPASSRATEGAGFDAASGGIVRPSKAEGGTLRLVATGDCDSWDPVNTTQAWCWNLQRLFTRTLLAYSTSPGDGSRTLVGDLATGLGEHNEDFTQWTYHLKAARWEDGKPITSDQVKYGLERTYASEVFTHGTGTYFRCLLAPCDGSNVPAYAGPYVDPSGGLDSISTPDERTIVFTLTSPTLRFDHLMTLLSSAPVPLSEKERSDHGAGYALRPLSSGPFKFQSHIPEEQVTWVRNDQWDAGTDTVRQPLLDQITLTINADADANDALLRTGAADLIADGGVNVRFQQAISSDPALKANADNPVGIATHYFAVFPQIRPLDNVHCRRAVAYALNKTTLLGALGGPKFGGSTADSMTPPGVTGHIASANAYPGGPDDTGDVTKAKEELQQCGTPNGFAIKQAYINSGRGPGVFSAAREALARVGIRLTAAVAPQSRYHGSYIGDPETVKAVGIGMAQAVARPQNYGPGGLWTSLAASYAPPGGGNYTEIRDKKVDDLLTSASVRLDPSDVLAQVDARVMELAVLLPFAYDKFVTYRNPRLTNVRLNVAHGSVYDIVNLGVNDQ